MHGVNLELQLAGLQEPLSWCSAEGFRPHGGVFGGTLSLFTEHEKGGFSRNVVYPPPVLNYTVGLTSLELFLVAWIKKY